MSQGHSLDHVVDTLPLLPLKDVVVFPQMILPVFISEDICLRAVEAACAKERLIFLSVFRSENQNEEGDEELSVSTPPPFDVYDIGTIATVLRTRKLPDGRTKILIQGLRRGRIQELTQLEPYPCVQVESCPEKEHSDPQESAILCRAVKEQVEKLVSSSKDISSELLMLLENVVHVGKISDLIAGNLPLKIVQAQKILGTLDVFERLRRVQQHLLKEFEHHVPPSHMRHILKDDGGYRAQKELFLREQLKSIRHELHESEARDEIEEMREKIKKVGMSQDAQNECLKQVRRLERMNADSSEAALTRTYIDMMLDLPWAKTCEQKFDLSGSKDILDEDHYGLSTIKDRILEYIAVKKLNPQLKGPILCFVGPPGVGKTSLGKSIARALGRKFVRLSLGGVRDEAEVRGHRRTYVGAMPGRVIQALRNVSSRNPVLMLDEIDKLASDYRGDPASALLEVLDPEQNHSFSDHYVAVPFDLSQVIFLANANRLDGVPAPLRDRLEIIDVSGYSEEEKMDICRQYIIPKVLTQNGLTPELVQFQDSSIQLLINAYTKESGLRSLEKQVAAVVRKLARMYVEGDERGRERKPIKVTSKLARELLGEERYLSDDVQICKKRVGVGIGLAYTQAGGEILELEVKLLPGNGKITITGQLGEVMRESAQTALSCVRAHAAEFDLNEVRFHELDVHIHATQGAIPKDGPSAGVIIAIALFSAFKGAPLRQDVAATGEITLHGRVLPVGGVREKLLAALRHGIKRVCLPEKNRSAFSELPVTLRRKVDVKFVSHFADVIDMYFAVDEMLESAKDLRSSENQDSFVEEAIAS